MAPRKASVGSLWLAASEHYMHQHVDLADTCACSASGSPLQDNPAKRWTEVLFLVYSPFWILWALGILVPMQLYEVQRKLLHCISSARTSGACILCSTAGTGATC